VLLFWQSIDALANSFEQPEISLNIEGQALMYMFINYLKKGKDRN
jgi:hypothetical protein